MKQFLLIFSAFLLATSNALYQTADAAAPDVPKIKPTIIYSSSKIGVLKSTGHDIYKLKGACNLDNVYTKDWVHFDGSTMKITLYCDINSTGVRGAHMNLVRMTLIHYG